MFIYILLLITLFLLLIVKSKKGLHMLQQNLYNENNRYGRWIWKNKKQLFSVEIIAIVLVLIMSLFTYKRHILSLVIILLIIFIYLFRIFFLHYEHKKAQEKKPLVITARIKRLIVTITILHLLPILILLFNWDNKQTVLLSILVLTIMINFNYIIIFLANLINYPVERMVYHYYETKAKNKLKSMDRLKIIGITGSYGKTSCKNILSDILNIKYIARPTPKNLNTYYGLMITVNNHLDKFDEIFIAEMGAYVKGEIRGLCELVHPQYGILTTIGTAHLETFGSEENIVQGKFELIESLPSDGVGVLNGDDKKQMSYQLKNNCKILLIGIENKDVDVLASNITCGYQGTNFMVKFKGDNKEYPFETKLLGKHNVYNILAALALGYEFGISIKQLQQAVKMVQPVEHRLQLKKLGNFYQIDDAYNSNPVGAKNALDVLEMMPGLKVVVTPGMIELGDQEDEYNESFGEQIAKVADFVVLIGKKQTKAIYKGLEKQNYNKDKIIIYNDVKESYKFIQALEHKNGVYALFENDLPDTYNE